ncbi:MAG: hypothetical protein DMG08_30445, partial [Acidobacteria bacterium]
GGMRRHGHPRGNDPLKARPDRTLLDGHHRSFVLEGRGVDVNRLPRELLTRLYSALQRLLKEELVKAEWSISSTNRRVRIYKLTAKGAKHLEQEVSRFEKMLEGITRVLAPGES